MPDNAKNIKEYLRLLIRKRKDINQKTIAGRVGITQSMLSMALRGQRKCSIDLLVAVAEACGTSIGEIERRITVDQSAKIAADTISETVAEYKTTKVVDLEHEEVITRFIDKETARQINYMLVEIESANNDQYEAICDMIKTIYGRLAGRKRAGPNKKELAGGG